MNPSGLHKKDPNFIHESAIYKLTVVVISIYVRCNLFINGAELHKSDMFISILTLRAKLK